MTYTSMNKRIERLEVVAGGDDRNDHVIMWCVASGWDHALAQHGKPILPGEKVLSIELVGVRPGIPADRPSEIAAREYQRRWMETHDSLASS